MEVDMLLVYLIVGIILIFIVLGILIWAIVSIARGKGKKAPQGKSVQTATSSERSETAQKATSAAMPASIPKPVAGDPELLRIHRDIQTGTIYVEIDGKRYNHLADIYNPQTSRLLLQTVVELNRFTRGVTPATSAKPASPESPGIPSRNAGSPSLQESPPSPGSLAKRGEALLKEPQTPKVEPGTIPPSGSGLLERGFKLSSTPTPAPKAPPQAAGPDDAVSAFEKAKPKTELGSFWSRALTPPSATAAKVGPRPLADELEDILHDIIGNMPSKPTYIVHFKTAADGRLIIEVNGAAHHDVNDVQDDAARQIIQAVIQQWEAK